LTYEDIANGFKMQYPYDWNKTYYKLNASISTVVFVPLAQNTTDRFLENLGVTVEPLPAENITLDQYARSAIEQLKLFIPEFNVVTSPKETMLGGVPAYNITYTQELPSTVDKIIFVQIWAIKYDRAYTIGYAENESLFNRNIDKVQKMIDSFSFLPSQQTAPFLTKNGKTEDQLGSSNVTGSETNATALSDFITYENLIYGIRIQYPYNWITREDILDIQTQEYTRNDDFYRVVNFIPSENGLEDSPFGIGVGIERLSFQESTMTEYIQESIDLLKYPDPDDFRIIELNMNSSVGGKPAFKYIFSYLENNIKQMYLQIGTIIAGKVYYIYFSAPEQEFSQYLPTIEKMIDSVKIVPTDKPPAPPSVNKAVKFLTYENSTLGIRKQYPSDSKLEVPENISYGVGFALPDEESPDLFYDTLSVEVIPLPYAVSGSAFIDVYVPIWVSGAKGNLTNFDLTKSKVTTLDDSPGQKLEYTYTDKNALALTRELRIFAVEDNILYHIGYEPRSLSSYYDHIPIIQKMIESFEILDMKRMLHVEVF
jgi:hypothetical protein